MAKLSKVDIAICQHRLENLEFILANDRKFLRTIDLLIKKGESVSDLARKSIESTAINVGATEMTIKLGESTLEEMKKELK